MKPSEFYLALMAFLLTIYVPVMGFLVLGPSAYFQFFAADTFYYLTIAANSSWSTLLVLTALIQPMVFILFGNFY